MPAEENEPKIGSGHAAAMARLGLSELRGALYNESNVAQPGAQLARGEDHVPTVEERLQAADQERSSREPEPPGIERE